jgi:hypothetical protein
LYTIGRRANSGIIAGAGREFASCAATRKLNDGSRKISSFECAVCGVTMESWNTAWVPAYRLVVGRIRKPDQN